MHLQRREGLLDGDLGKVYCLSCSWSRGSSGWRIILSFLLLACIDLNFQRSPIMRVQVIASHTKASQSPQYQYNKASPRLRRLYVT